jgi:hypothetical protein
MQLLPTLVAHAAAAAVLVASVVLSAGASAQRLHLPQEVADACPGCRVIACGSEAVRHGKGYSGTALLGEPRRGYVIFDAIDAPTFRQLARTIDDHARLTAELTARFQRARVVAMEATLKTARILAEPPEVTVRFPQPLHQCLRDHAKPWGCCMGAGCRGECCEKGLGSPQVTLTWKDAYAGETLRMRYSHTYGATVLTRKGASTTTYWCLTDSLARMR